MWFSVPKLLVQKIWFMTNTCFFFREPGILGHARQGVPRWPWPIKILGTKSLMSFPDKHFTHLLKLIARGTKCLLYECTGRRLLEACTRFPSDFVHVTFSLLILLCILSLQGNFRLPLSPFPLHFYLMTLLTIPLRKQKCSEEYIFTVWLNYTDSILSAPS